MMNKTLCIGDSLFFGKDGYGVLLESQIILHNPRLSFEIFCYTKEQLGFADILKDAPFHIIGKAPQVLLLAMGYDDLASKAPEEQIKESVQNSIQLLLDKTQAFIILPNLSTAFFKGDETRLYRCIKINEIFTESGKNFSRVALLDINTITNNFIKLHAQSRGTKRALYSEGPRLTSLGALLLASSVFDELNHYYSLKKTREAHY